jgi:glycerol-3-phosphate O-acyltransferase 3/4
MSFNSHSRYDFRYADAFWNSLKHTPLQYLFLIMTSWALVCDITYLPPMRRQDNESAEEFAKRVKFTMSETGGFVDLPWDPQVKRMKSMDHWKRNQQAKFAETLK